MSIIAGIDLSTDKYLGLVVGANSDILSIHDKLGIVKIHMRMMDNQSRLAVIRRCVLKGNVRVICLRIDRSKIVKSIHNKLTRKSKFKPRKFVQNNFDYILRKLISRYIEAFITKHEITLNELPFEADQDMIKPLRTVGLKIAKEEKAHELADVIGWANHKRISISSVLEYDLTNEIEELLTKRLGL